MIMNRSNHSGFSLIEVMLAVLVLSVGILGVSKLQGQLIRSGAEANQRSVASNLIQQKSDDLRRFVNLTTSNIDIPDVWANTLSPTSLAFVHIASNEGGLIAPGNHTVGNVNYDLQWQVKDYIYAGNDSIAIETPAALPSFKMVHIVVSWDSVSPINNVVSFDTIIDSYNLANTALGGQPASAGSGPDISYDPLAAPDVLPVTLGVDGLKKETSKPLPDVSKKGDSTLVKFDTVTYNPNNDTQRREEFRTLACKCNSAGSTPTESILKGLVTWDNIDKRIIDLAVETPPTTNIVRTNVDNGGGEDQDDACTICCRDGADGSDPHFKVCRLKRIDGVLRVFDPWKLVAFNMVPASYFNDSHGHPDMTTTFQSENIAKYSTYVTTTVRDILAATGSRNAFNNYSTVDLSFINDTDDFTNDGLLIEHLLHYVGDPGRNIQVRGVYMDYPPDGIFTRIIGQTTYYDSSTVPLDRVPFYEVNLTQLAGWVPDVVEVVNTTNNDGDLTFTQPYPEQHDTMDNSCTQPVTPPTDRNYVTNEAFYEGSGGVYTTCHNASRGRFNPVVSTPSKTITSQVYTGSDGIVDRSITGNTTVDVSLDIEVSNQTITII